MTIPTDFLIKRIRSNRLAQNNDNSNVIYPSLRNYENHDLIDNEPWFCFNCNMNERSNER